MTLLAPVIQYIEAWAPLVPMIQYIEARTPLASMIQYIEARAPLGSMIRYMKGAPGAYDSTYRGESTLGAYYSLYAGCSSMMSEMHDLNKKKKGGKKKGGKGRKMGEMKILNGCLGYMPTPEAPTRVPHQSPRGLCASNVKLGILERQISYTFHHKSTMEKKKKQRNASAVPLEKTIEALASISVRTR